MKRILSFLLVLVLMLTPLLTHAAAGVAPKGDVNRDGGVDMKDVLLLRKHIAQMDVEIDLAVADVNGDGNVDMKDVLLVRRHIAGLDPWPDESSAEPSEIASDRMSIFDKSGTVIGDVDGRASCTAVDGGIFYSLFAPAEGQSTATAEYRFFSLKTREDVRLGRLENQGYETTFARTEYGGLIYTLAIVGNPMSDQPVTLMLLAFDTVACTMKSYAVSETGFPYASLAVSNGKLLIMNHEMTSPKTDSVYAFDPAAGTVTRVLSFSSATDSLRGVSAASDGFYLLRLKLNPGSENEVMLDRYDAEYRKVSEQSIRESLVGAAMKVHGIISRSDALNELGMSVGHFAVLDDRYLLYENFGLTRVIVDLQSGETLLAKDDVYSVSNGSGAPVVYRMDFDPENVAEPEIIGLAGGELTSFSFTPSASHPLIKGVSRSAAGTWLVLTSDGYAMHNSSLALHLF